MSYIPPSLSTLTAYNGVMSSGGAMLAINATTTQFDVATFKYRFVDKSDPENPIVSLREFAGQTGIEGDFFGTNVTTFIYLRESDRAIVQFNTPQGGTRLYDHILIGNLNSDPTDLFFDNVVTTPQIGYGLEMATEALLRILGGINVKALITSGNADLTFQSTLGDGLGMGRNYPIDANIPHIESYAGESIAGTLSGFIIEAFEDTSGDLITDIKTGKDIDPAVYNNAGVSGTVNASQWSIKRLFFFYGSNVWVAYRGNAVYNSLDAAKAGEAAEDFTENIQTFEAVFAGFIFMKGNATQTNNAAEVEFKPRKRTRL